MIAHTRIQSMLSIICSLLMAAMVYSPTTALPQTGTLRHSRIYVADHTLDGSSVSIFDATDNSSLGSIPLGGSFGPGSPSNMVANLAGTRLYVGPVFDVATNNVAISVINTTTNTVITKIPLATSISSGLAITRDGAKLYVSDGTDTISVVSTATNSVVDTIPLGSITNGVVVSPDGSRIYALHPCCDFLVSTVDVASKTVIGKMPMLVLGGTGTNPRSMTMSPDGRLLYITTIFDTVLAVDTINLTTVANVIVGTAPQNVGFNSNSASAYVANGSGVSIIDTSTSKVVKSIMMLGNPYSLVPNRNGTQLYVSTPNGNTLSVVDLVRDRVVATLQTGLQPTIVVFIP
jgi:YVTN family beta-propeller protein